VVDKVVMERLREGRRLPTIGGGGGGRRVPTKPPAVVAVTVVFGRCGGCGRGGEAAPTWGMVDEVVMERLREGRRLPTIDGGGRGLRVQRNV